MSSQIKLTKNAYRSEKAKLVRLEAYLPTLKLKKALLQVEVTHAMREANEKSRMYQESKDRMHSCMELCNIPLYIDAITSSLKIERIETDYENITGVEVPVVKNVILAKASYSVLDTPCWIDTLITYGNEYIMNKVHAKFAAERQRILEEELRNVTIRVNLFEKKLIPETKQIIRKIAIFLSDRSITSVGQMKMSKKKIRQHNEESECA